MMTTISRSLTVLRKRLAGPSLALLFSSVLVVTTGLVGLVVEDWLPKDGVSFDPGKSTLLRVVLAIGAVAFLAALAWGISRNRTTNGTLYHVRLLSERARDYHAQAIARARSYALGYRSITRSLSLGTGGWVDVVDVVDQARAALEQVANTDDISTTYEVAINAHWPIEFALGTEWPLLDGAELLEFHRKKSHPVLAVCADPDTITPIPKQESTDEPRLVHLEVHLSDQDLITTRQRERNWNNVFDRPAEITLLWGVEQNSRRIRAFTAPADERVPVTIAVRDAVTPEAAAQATARAILMALDRYPRAVIVVSTRIPKTVAVLAGRYFAAHLQQQNPKPENTPADDPAMIAWHRRIAQSQNWNDPWRRLILLSFNDSIQSMQAMKVRAAQPDHTPRLVPDLAAATLVNLTPHTLVVLDDLGRTRLTVPREGPFARVSEIRAAPTRLAVSGTDVPLTDLHYADTVTDLPAPHPGTVFVVSRITAQALPGRTDLVFPLDEVRDAQHRIIGCRGLGRLHEPGR